jgi:cell division protein FtsA
MAVLTQDERDLGVALVDISAGNPTDVAIFCRRRGRHRRDPSAGDLITGDIAMALRTPTKDAETSRSWRLRQTLLAMTRTPRWKCPAWVQPAHAQPQALARGDRAPPRNFVLVQQAIRESGYEGLLSSITSGSRRQLPGMVELGEDISQTVRRGLPLQQRAV